MIEYQELAHNKLLLARRLERLVSSPLFERVSKKFTEKEKEKVKEHIDKLDPTALRELIRKHDGRELGDLSLRELRIIAKRLHIKNYCRSPQWLLINEVQKTIKLNESMTGETVDIMELFKEWKKTTKI